MTSPPSPTRHNPGADWERLPSPEAAGLGAADVAALEEVLFGLPTTALLVIRSGRIAYSYGDIVQSSYLASARKSILSMLFGNHVANGTIDLDLTLGELGIDDAGGLLPIEKTATIRHLLMSSSGVYAPAGSPGANDATPPRGSKQPGSHFHYNNWDFNVAGAVFQQLTGKSVFQAFAEDLAGPLQMQDFDPARQRMLGYEANPPRFKAYHMFLSARDMARLGLLMINGGRWNGKQIVPEAWIAESTALRVKAEDVAANSPLGYAYLWWVPSESRKGPAWVGAFQASGNFGQAILCLPAIDTVVVQRRAVPDELAIARNLGRTRIEPPSVSAADRLRIADMVVDAITAG